MNAAMTWGDAPTSRASGAVYTDETLYREELERFFYRGHWSLVLRGAGMRAAEPR
jgi:salicylate 5-hydroxylase large subunit